MPTNPNRNKKPQCRRINDQLAQQYFAQQLSPAQHYEVGLHFINCEACFLVVQKWGRFTGNGSVPIGDKTLLEYRPGEGTITTSDGTIISLSQVLNKMFGHTPEASLPLAEQPTNIVDNPGLVNNADLAKKIAQAAMREKQQLTWQIGQERAAIQQTLEKTLAELAHLNAQARCPRHQELTALLKGTLLGQSWDNLDTHLADCVSCQHFCLTLIDIYSLQKRRELEKRRELASTIATAAEPEHHLTPATVTPAHAPQINSQKNCYLEEGNVTMATTLTNDEIPYPMINNKINNKFLTAAAITLLLVSGLGYYLQQPPSPPPMLPNNLKAAVLSTTTLSRPLTSELAQQLEPLVTVAANKPNKNLLTPANIQQIEDLVKSRELDVAQNLLLPALAQARATNNKAMQVKLLYLQGRIYGERADFGRAIVTLQEAIEIAKSLNDVKLLLQPTFTLATVYYVTDQNAAAASQAANCLAFAQQCQDLVYQSASLQMLAISQFVANKSPQSEGMLKQSLQLALACKNFDYVLQGYTYLGVIKTERKQYVEAAKWFDKALEFAKQETNLQKQAYLTFTVKGYYARSQALAGNVSAATHFYQQAIEQANQAKVVQHLALSQLYQGLGACYTQQKQQLNAERAFAKSEVLEEEAYKRCEINNTAMSFALERQAARRCN